MHPTRVAFVIAMAMLVGCINRFSLEQDVGGSSVSTTTPTVLADGATQATIDIVIRTSRGVPVADVDVRVQSSCSTCVIGQPPPTDAQGRTQATVTSSRVANAVFEASAYSVIDTVRLPGSVAIEFMAGAPNNVASTIVSGASTAVSGQNGVGIADGVDTVPVTVIIRDPSGNPIGGVTVTFTDSDPNGKTIPATVVTDANGVATTQVSSSDTGTQTVTATTSTGINVSTTVDFQPPTPKAATSMLAASPASQVADGVNFITVTATVNDAAGVKMPGQTVAFSAAGSQFTFTPAGGTTDLNGRLSTQLLAGQAQTLTVNAIINGSVTLSQSVSFYAGNPNSQRSTFTASPTSQTVTQPVALQVKVLDAFSNPIAGQNVTFSGGVGSAFSPASSGTTDASGIFNANITSTVAQAASITAALQGFNLSAAVTFTAGAVDAGHSTFTINPNTATADGSAFVPLHVSLADVYGNPVSGASVTFVPAGISHTFNPASTGTTVGGVFNANLTSTHAQIERITAQAGGQAFNANAIFNAGTINGFNSLATATPLLQVADGVSNVYVTVKLQDTYNNPVANASVTFSASGTSNAWSPIFQGVTDANGFLSTNLTSTLVQIENVYVSNGVTFPLNAGGVTFVAGPPAALSFTQSQASPMHTPCGMGNFVVGVYDAHGNFCKNANTSITVSLGNPNTGGTVSGTTTVAAVNGNAVFSTLTYSVSALAMIPGPQPLVAQATGLTSASSPNFVTKACAITTAAANGATLSGVHAGDLNADGRPDLIVDSRGNKAVTFYYYNSATATFSQGGGNTLTQSYHNIAVGDYDGDGYADYAVNDASVNSNTTSGTVYLNNHNGFTPSTVGIGANANCIVSMDVNNDGKLDLIGGSTSGLISWVFGNGSGSFSTWGNSNTFAGNAPAMWPAVGKFTGRAAYDVAYMAYTTTWNVNVGYNGNGSTSVALNQNDIGAWGSLNGNSIYLATSNGGAQLGFKFTPGNSGSLGFGGNTSNGSHVYFSDMNGDGSADLITTTDTGCVCATSVPATVSFATGVAYTSNHRAVWATAGDFNLDGVSDIALANGDTQSFSVIFLP